MDRLVYAVNIKSLKFVIYVVTLLSCSVKNEIFEKFLSEKHRNSNGTWLYTVKYWSLMNKTFTVKKSWKIFASVILFLLRVRMGSLTTVHACLSS
jgi:hypothetical protein